METAILILQALNQASPGIANLILIIKRNDGNITVAAMLDEADEQFQSNVDSAKAWLAAHQGPDA